MTPLTLTSLADLKSLDVDTIIDVRAPSEFAEDHIPGAINLPVLSDHERAEVGTVYTRVSPFKARKIGGALVAQNTAHHLQTALAGKDGGWQPLVYCWRGGQRSGAFATILDQVGWRVRLLQGGYQSYRREVVKSLYDTQFSHRITLIAGGTGTAKTALLHHLADAGAQMLDLEGLAEHRGSLFGGIKSNQPAQKMFETRVAAALAALDPAKTTFIEAESSKIGQRIVPPALWAAMITADRIQISAPIDARSRFLCRAYADLTEDKAHLGHLIDQLRPYHSADIIALWHAQATKGEWQALAAGLITAHYDPRYAKSAASAQPAAQTIELSDLDDATLAKAAKRLAGGSTQGHVSAAAG
ncbi:Sulfurtransferase [Sulfitobacter noctilucicola]|uniref:tRNA 2-selenouridine synthase n=1 Tax=Sulfitobacter noctilucicola TaxID=1342301 RepID=A0A7W6M5Z6_9RHOB|nr:tRNA 2-selenouridine(34) synthase MnmH [Sulfitobacter noctilucicola]KIN62459.1 Sulfurtransferase [Sulfitobacter noctilucicola]MBB4173009.1 tRNA 2-selenouridine synthase [Sulfitobacter noctilucicola]